MRLQFSCLASTDADHQICPPLKQTFAEVGYRLWRCKFRGFNVSDATRLKDVEAENNRLKNLLAESLLENEIAKEALRIKRGAHRHDLICCVT